MQLKRFIFGLMAMLSLLVGVQQPLLAAKNVEKEKRYKQSSSSSSSHHHKNKKCCKEVLELVQQIDQTTVQDLIVDEQILSVTNHINQTTQADLAVDQETLGVVNQINQTTQEDLAVDQEILDTVSKIYDCACKCQVIMPEDFMDVNGKLSQTVVLAAPGQYCLGADIDFEPLVANTQALQILSDNVTLTLSGFTLRQINTTAGAVGVRLGNSAGSQVLKNIKVENGSIVSFTGVGVLANNTIVTTPAAFQFLEFSNLDLLACGVDSSSQSASGINLTSNGDQNLFTNPLFAYKNVTIENCRANSNFGIGAIRVATGDNVVLRNCQANDLSSSANVSPFGYRFSVRNLQMFDCQGNGARSTSATNTGGQVGGMSAGGCIDVFVQNCQFNESFGEACFIVNGVNISNQQNALYENCQFNNPRGGNNSTIINGIHMSDSAFQRTSVNGVKFVNCQFNGATRSSTGIGAFPEICVCTGTVIITAKNVEFEKCQACNISTDNKNYATIGFRVQTLADDPIPFYSNTQNITFTECVASEINAPFSATGFQLGTIEGGRIGDQASHPNVVIRNCTAEKIYSSTSTDVVAGIYEGFAQNAGSAVFPLSYNLYVDGCRISDVKSNKANPSPLSGGIVVNAVKRPVITDNSISDCDRGILLTGTNDVYPNNVFQLAASSANALAVPPIPINLIGTTTYSTGTASQSGTTVTGVGTTFTSAMVGGTISFGSVAGTGSQTGDIVTATGAVFTSSMVGSTISFPNGYTTYIVDFIDAQNVQVSTTVPAPLPPALAFTVNVNVAPITGFTSATQISVSKFQTISPAVPFTIVYGLPASSPNQTFTNNVAGRGGPVSISPSSTSIDLNREYITAPVNINFGGGVARWQSGDSITYNNGGGTNIGNLANGNYYLITYIPGYSENGVIKDNVVDNCSVSGYEDTRPVTTTSAWINNVAMNNGTPCIDATNYDIVWTPGPYPVDSGFVGGPYPAGTNKWINMSLKP